METRELHDNPAQLYEQLGTQAFTVLIELIRRSPETVKRERLVPLVWGDGRKEPCDGLKKIIKKLRIILEDSASHPHYVQTVREVGYRFIAEVMKLPALKPQAALETSSSKPDTLDREQLRKEVPDQLDSVVSDRLDETFPHHYLELLTQESERGLIIALNNPKHAVMQDCRVVLRALAMWSTRKGKFMPNEMHQPVVLINSSSIATQRRSAPAYLAMVNKADKTQLLLHEPGGFRELLKKKGVWRAELSIRANRRRTLNTAVFFEWNPGEPPRFIAEPKRSTGAEPAV